MRALADSTTVYKRQPSRDLASINGITAPMNGITAPMNGNDIPADGSVVQGNRPTIPWTHSFPHACIGLLVAFLFGYHMGVVNIPLLAIARDLNVSVDPLAQGFIVSSLLIAAFAGCGFSGIAADKLGRRRSFQLSSIPMILGSIVSAKAANYEMMIAGRVLVGLGLGIGGPVLALYLSEISPTEIRGAYGSLGQIANCVGILGASVAGLPISYIPTWWRACFWISALPASFLLLGMEFCAESPRWLLKKSRWYEAEHELERLWGPANAKVAMSEMGPKEVGDNGMDDSWLDLIDHRYIKVVLIGAAIFALQQFSGINAVFYFSSVVLKEAGVSSEIAATVCVGVVNLLGSCLAAYLMDKQGRRLLMIISFCGMGAAMVLQAAGAAFYMLKPVQGSVTLMGTLLYVFMFSVGAGPVPALLLPEIFPTRIRAKAMAVAMCSHWISNFMVGLTYLELLKRLGAGNLYLLFSTTCFGAAVFVKKYVVETKGRSLEDIEALLLPDLPL